MKLTILSCAESELVEAVEYYNLQCPGLGYEFAVEVQRVLDRIRQYPTAWPVFSERSRRCFLNRFPYGILYQIRDHEILIAAIMHLKRSPRAWNQRI